MTVMTEETLVVPQSNGKAAPSPMAEPTLDEAQEREFQQIVSVCTKKVAAATEKYRAQMTDRPRGACDPHKHGR